MDVIVNHTADMIRYRERSGEYRSRADYPYSRKGGLAGQAINPRFAGDHNPAAANFARLTDPAFAYTPFVLDAERQVNVPGRLNEPLLYHTRDHSTFTGESSRFGDIAGIDDLFTECPRVGEGLIAIYARWIEDFGIDTARHFDPAHPLYRLIARLARQRRAHPPLARRRQVIRGLSEKPGLFSVSRFNPATGAEYWIAFNTSDAAIHAASVIGTNAEALETLFGACPARVSAPGSVMLDLPAFGCSVCRVHTPQNAVPSMTQPKRTPEDLPELSEAPWWQGAAIYQIYPRSFCDSNSDGIGDLPGITAKLDHVAALGVDAIWVSPFFTSPMRDFGYDVADYCDVDPIFGTLADFDRMVARAHELGLKVTIDQVYAHTSDQHPWFAESRQSKDNPRADWYVWADPREDGSPPSNWQSVFGGPAWTWDARRCQYYMHNFLSSQPQINAHNPAVQEALLGVMQFWLDRGVDGFRIDALNFLMHDPAMRANPPAPYDGRRRTRPFDYQLKVYNQSHPDIVQFIQRLRGLCDHYGSVFTLAEVGGDFAETEMKDYTAGADRLNSAYGFDFLYANKLTPALVCDTQGKWPDAPGTGWPSWAFENHDAPRALSRWCAPEDIDAFARMKMLLLASLRGNIILYQGEELGLTQVEIPFEQIQDPEAIANWPLTLSRDGARTPMPWQAQGSEGGFTSGTPWLPLGSKNHARAADRQEADPASLLHFTRGLLALRKAHPALRIGDFSVLHADAAVLAFRREAEGSSVIGVFNMSASPAPWPASAPQTGTLLIAANGAAPGQLPPFAAILIHASSIHERG